VTTHVLSLLLQGVPLFPLCALSFRFHVSHLRRSSTCVIQLRVPEKDSFLCDVI